MSYFLPGLGNSVRATLTAQHVDACLGKFIGKFIENFNRGYASEGMTL